MSGIDKIAVPLGEGFCKEEYWGGGTGRGNTSISQYNLYGLERRIAGGVDFDLTYKERRRKFFDMNEIIMSLDIDGYNVRIKIYTGRGC